MPRPNLCCTPRARARAGSLQAARSRVEDAVGGAATYGVIANDGPTCAAPRSPRWDRSLSGSGAVESGGLRARPAGLGDLRRPLRAATSMVSAAFGGSGGAADRREALVSSV